MDLTNQAILTHITHTEKVRMLEITTWVNYLTASQIDKLAYYFKPYVLPPNSVILEEGVKGGFFGLIYEGQVDIVKENASGQKKKLQTFGAGKSVGEMSFFDRGPSSATVIAKDTVTLLVIDETDFDYLCTEAPSLALQITINLIAIISQRLRQTTGKLIDLL